MNQFEIFPRDVFPEWEKAIKQAKNNIKIFTPYFSKTLIELLEEKPSGLKYGNVTLITSLYSCFRELDTLYKIARRGVKVKHLSELHAKALIIDNDVLVFGSQNFTVKGRRNKEISAINRNIEVDKLLIPTIIDWEQQALNIPVELIKELNDLSELNEIRIVVNEKLNDIREIIEKYLDKIELKNIGKEITSKDEYKIAPKIKVQLNRWDSKGYFTLNTIDKTSINNILNIRNTLVLRPILNLDSGEMRFIRLGDKECSFITEEIETPFFDFEVLKLDESKIYLKCYIKLSKKDIRKGNMLVTVFDLRNPERQWNQYCKFDGESLKTIDDPFFSKDAIEDNEFKFGINKKKLKDKKSFEKWIFNTHFKGYKPDDYHKELHKVAKQNLEEYLQGEPTDQYELGNVEIYGNSFLTISKI